MMDNVLIGLSLQRAYFHPDGSYYMGEKAEVLKPRILEYLKEKKSSCDIIFTREVHSPSDKFYRNSKSHSLVGSADVEIMEMFKPFPKLMVNVTRADAFFMTPLESELHKRKPRSVTLIGVETHNNVLFTAEHLRNLDYDVTVPEALVNSYHEFIHVAAINILCNGLSVSVI